MRVGIATDHGGYGLKEELLIHLRVAGYEVVDFGAHSLNPSDDYPDFVIPLARAVAAAEVERGVAICGSGADAAQGIAAQIRLYPRAHHHSGQGAARSSAVNDA